MLLLEQLMSVTLPKVERLKLLPYLLMTPMLAEYARRVYLTSNEPLLTTVLSPNM